MEPNKTVTTTGGSGQPSRPSDVRPGTFRPGGSHGTAGRGAEDGCAGEGGAARTDTFGSNKKETIFTTYTQFTLYFVYTRLGMIYWVGYIHMKNDVK